MVSDPVVSDPVVSGAVVSDAGGMPPEARAGMQPGVWTGAVGAPTRLVLLRHGQTALSAQRRYSGRGDPPLSDIGLRQAKAAAHRLAQPDSVAAGTRAVLANGGSLSHHHAVGVNRARFVPEALGGGLAVLDAVKRALDPHGICNPGKLGLADPFGGRRGPHKE